MKFKKSIIISLFLIIFFAIGAVSATDDVGESTDDVLSLSTVNELEVIENGGTTELFGLVDDASSDETLLENENPTANSAHFNGTTMSELSSFIRNSQYSIIELDKDIEQEGNNPSYIMLNKQITINGNNHTIDLKELSYAFRIHNTNVTLMNIIFKNGLSESAGAIYSTNSGYCTIDNCIFINNSASKNGGAVYLYSSEPCYISNCIFIDNIASSNGGGIYVLSDVKIENCIFNNNNAECGGGIYSSNGYSEVTNCNFTGNSARHGAGVYSQDLNILNCNFISNIVDDATGAGARAGALYSNGISYLRNCNFTDNHAKTNKGYGGAIYLKQNSNIIDCNFANDTAGISGGAIYVYTDAICNLTNCNFINNHADTSNIAYGGAVLANYQINFNECKFSKNSAVSTGGAIYSAYGDCNLNNCEFDNNVAGNISGAVYAYTIAQCNLNNCNFINNNASSCGAFYGEGNIINCNFTNNHALVDDSGAIYSTKSLTLTNSIFNDNSAGRDGGAVYTKEAAIINDCIFNDNSAGRDGGAICSRVISTLSNCTFNNHSAVRYGGSVKKCDASDCDFVNSVSRNGGAIFQGDASDCYFVNCSSDMTGSAIYQGNAEDSVFINCYNSRGIIFNGTSTNCIFAESPTLYCPDMSVNYGETISIPVRVLDKDANDVNGLDVDVKIYSENKLISSVATESGSSIRLHVDADSYIISLTSKYLTPYNASIVVNTPKIDPNISVQDITIVYGEDAVINVYISSDAMGTISVDGVSKRIKNGEVDFVISDLDVGTHVLPVVYSGDNKYNSVNTTVNVVVNPKPSEKVNASMNITADDIFEGEDAVINVYISSDAMGTISVDGVSKRIKNGEVDFVISDLDVGTHVLPVVYSGDNKYNSVNATVNVVVNPKPSGKINASMNITADDISEGEDAVINVVLPKDATGTVTADNSVVPVDNGAAVIIISNLPVGKYNIPVTYSGDEKYNPLTKNISFSVMEKNLIVISAPDLTKYYGGSEKFIVNVADKDGNPLSNIKLTITLNGGSYNRTTDDNGVAGMNIALPANNYAVLVSFAGNDDYSPANITSNIIIKTTVNGSDVNKVEKASEPYYATFLDSNGNKLVSGQAEFNINGIFYKRNIIDGVSKLNLNLGVGTYIITAKNPLTNEMTSNKIIIRQRFANNSNVVKYYRNDTQYYITLLGDDGKPVGANEIVTFNINGVMYERKTNENGTARMNINLNPGDYIITAMYKGCMISNNIKVLPIIKAKDITMTYRDGTRFTAALLDGKGNPYLNQTIIFNINGVFYHRTTGSDGIAKLNINLMPGKYIITSYYGTFATSNEITIKL